MRHLGWAALLGGLVLACSPQTPPPQLVIVTLPPLPPAPAAAELAVVLPNADGGAGTITAVVDGVSYLLDRPYAAVSRGADGRAASGVRSADEVQAIFGPTLAARPLPPVSFALYFEFGTDTLTPASTVLVQQILAEIARYPAAEIVLIGHTDQAGSDLDNDVLSMQRAGRVREGLIRKGIAPDMITVVGRGKRDATSVAEKDRRVDLVLR